jgi:hypothetical protein
MTAVMRAVAPTGPKVLRVGVVRDGKVIEERVIADRSDVAIGPSEKSTFVVPSSTLARRHVLFQRAGDSYVLRYLDWMEGRVALAAGVSDLRQLRGQAGRGSDGSFKLRLTEDSRGKVQVGELTFLFQFVAPPPIQPRPHLPVAVTRGATGIDWRTTIIAAFAFLFHFMAIGAMYSDWLDPPVDDDLSLAGLVETLDQLPPPPPPEEKPEEEPEEVEEAPKEVKPEPAQQAPTKIPETGKLNEAQAAALSNELEQLSMATLGALADLGPATAGVLQGSEVPTGALDAAAASNAGVGIGGDLKLGSSGGVVQPGQQSSLSDIGTTKAGSTSSGTAKKVEGPKGSASVSSQVSAGSVDNASRIVAGMRAGFRRCFQRALEQNPDIGGSIRLTLTVGPGGEVSGVSASQSGNLPSTVVSCVKSRARAAQFSPPAGGSAVVEVPVTFVKQ